MASQAPQLHFVMFPFMAQGHVIPMMDVAKILVQHSAIVTVVTTPHIATRFTPIVARYIEAGFHIRLVQLPFPYKEAGVPDGCDSVDMLPSTDLALNFFNATNLLRQPVEKLFAELTPPPSCIISDMCLPYTIHIANKFNIPRISFVGVSCFYLLCTHDLRIYDDFMQRIATESEYFVLPGIVDKIEMTKAQTGILTGDHWKEFHVEMVEAEMATYGIIVNSFEELEPAYARDYKKVRGDKMWTVGPLSLSNKDHFDKVQRGHNKVSIDECQYLKWLDCHEPRTVIYACFGSVCNLTSLQLIEVGLALEASKRPFIWVIRERSQQEALEKWIKEDGFEERTKDRSLVVRGWAPQLLILSHPAIGGFITHSGWNSTLEAICASVPMVTWPLFADQFFNERQVVEILKVGVKVGVESPQEEDSDVMVKKEDIERAVEKLMGETSESDERRKRIKELAEMAKTAVEQGGSSHFNITSMIQDIQKITNLK